MKIYTTLFISLLTLGATFSSCKKNGTGGKASLHIQIAHHSVPINGATLYIKFGAQDMPSNPITDYDLKLLASQTDSHIQVENLRPGDYYLYAVGFDPAVNQTLEGGIPVKIKWKERKENIDVNLAITEVP